jgi:hypothetical protein
MRVWNWAHALELAESPVMEVVLRRAALIWVPLAVALTGVCGVVYATVQQDLRQGANDPQIQMAEDAAARLEGGASTESVLPARTVELSSSLDTYVMVFDRADQLMSSSAKFHGNTPPFPPDVLRNATGQDRVTWQPEVGVRSAVVVQPWRDGFVVAGRSLRLIEEREQQVLLIASLAWAVTLGATAVAALAVSALLR